MAIDIKDGIPVEPLPASEVIIALYQTENVTGWLLSGIVYRDIKSAYENLSAFRPTNIKCFRLDLG